MRDSSWSRTVDAVTIYLYVEARPLLLVPIVLISRQDLLLLTITRNLELPLESGPFSHCSTSIKNATCMPPGLTGGPFSHCATSIKNATCMPPGLRA